MMTLWEDENAKRGVEHSWRLPSQLIPHIEGTCCSEFRNPALLATSAMDVAVYGTPAGQLYDTSFLPKQEQELRKSEADYREKQWEMEVRKDAVLALWDCTATVGGELSFKEGRSLFKSRSEGEAVLAPEGD